MLIGELSRRTGVSERLLRYYEGVGLVLPERRANGYRDYPEDAVETVQQVRALLAAGLPTRVIREVLPCADVGAVLRPCPGVLGNLRAQLDVLDRRAADLDRARDELRRTIAATEGAQDGVRVARPASSSETRTGSTSSRPFSMTAE